jgi:hypothetical protein
MQFIRWYSRRTQYGLSEKKVAQYKHKLTPKKARTMTVKGIFG